MMDCWCCGLPNVLLVVTRPPVFCWIILQRALVVEGFVSICPMIRKFLWPYWQMILHVFYKKKGVDPSIYEMRSPRLSGIYTL